MQIQLKKHFVFISALIFTFAAMAIEKNSIVITTSEDEDLVTVSGEKEAAYFALKKLIGTNCGSIEKSNNEINFILGKQAFQVSHGTFIHQLAFLQKINISQKINSNIIEFSMPKTNGCKTNPANYLIAAFKADNDKYSYINLSEKDDSQNLLKYINFLNTEKLCKPTQHDFVIACFGSKTINNTKISVVFFMPFDEITKLPYNGETQVPVHARCEGTSEKDLVCNVIEYFAKNFIATIQVPLGNLSKDMILGARGQIQKFINSAVSK